jgi:two-component system response regulator HydG
MPKTLIIDDDRGHCLLLEKYLSAKGHKILKVHTVRKALEIIDGQDDMDTVICSERVGDTEARDILLRVRRKDPSVPVIIISRQNDVRTAIELMKLGAYDYLLKPLFPEDILHAVETALSNHGRERLASEPLAGTSAARDKRKNYHYGFGNDYVFGKSPAFRKMIDQIRLVSPTDYSVIIYGESGSGKEAIAHEIHDRSKRASKPFVAIDCGALSRDLAGSELFGHEKGAFTGAISRKTGSFELANGGTIFLDEIANLPYDIQASLLRVIQERMIRRVGGTRDIPIDVRIVISSNEILWDTVQKGKFREDLYHRFNEFSIGVPPLRELKDDIMFFANHFLVKANQTLGKQIKGFSPEVETIFRGNIWYGNLRELNNVVKRATLLAKGDHIGEEELPIEIRDHVRSFQEGTVHTGTPVSQGSPQQDLAVRPGRGNSLKEASLHKEYELIRETLEAAGHNKSKAARMLNIDRKTLYNKINAYQAMGNPGMDERG